MSTSASLRNSKLDVAIIAGSGRSGTTWLGSILNSYEHADYFYEICAYPELDFDGSNLLQVSTLFYGLGLVAETADTARLYLGLADLGLRVALLTMRQPVFWGLVLMAIALGGLWVRLMQQIYRRAPMMIELFI